MIYYIAVFDHTWGRGRTREEAVKQARKAGARGSVYYVKRMPPGAVNPYVDDFGGINWKWAEDHPEDQRDARPVLVYAGKGVKLSNLTERQRQELKDNAE
jgi:hypothetical protein